MEVSLATAKERESIAVHACEEANAALTSARRQAREHELVIEELQGRQREAEAEARGGRREWDGIAGSSLSQEGSRIERQGSRNEREAGGATTPSIG